MRNLSMYEIIPFPPLLQFCIECSYTRGSIAHHRAGNSHRTQSEARLAYYFSSRKLQQRAERGRHPLSLRQASITIVSSQVCSHQKLIITGSCAAITIQRFKRNAYRTMSGWQNQWYQENGMLVNESKHQGLVLGETDFSFSFPVQETLQIFGMEIDKKLNFSSHISNVCKKINNQL